MKKIFTILISVFLTINANSQKLNGGHFTNNNFGNDKNWYFTQTILNNEFSSNNYKKTTTTYRLTEDNNNDGIPDYKINLKINDNSDDLLLYTANFDNYIGTTVSIYQEFENTMYGFNGNDLFSPSSTNLFYRYSKICPANSLVRATTSLPILFQKPTNTSKRSCKIQIVYEIRTAKYHSTENTGTSDYQFFIPHNDNPYGSLTSNDSYYLYYNTENNFEITKSATKINSLKINWDKEEIKSKIIHEIILVW